MPQGAAGRAGCAIASGAAVAWALLHGGRLRREAGLIVAIGLPRRAFGRGGTTVGRVYLTDRNDSPAVLRHEAVHAEQWRRYGLTMPVRYLLAGRDPSRNRFEVEAGLEDGGYR